MGVRHGSRLGRLILSLLVQLVVDSLQIFGEGFLRRTLLCVLVSNGGGNWLNTENLLVDRKNIQLVLEVIRLAYK